MNTNEDQVHNAHNNMFVKTFSEPENVRVFLDMVLPKSIRDVIDLSQIHIEATNYISDQLKSAFSDLVIKTVLRESEAATLDIDIYFLIEHKSFEDDKSLIQLLKYMYLKWQNDIDQGKPLRVIIPLIFYHGEKEWKVPRSFVDNFKVSKELKAFLLDFSYLFFDTREWDFRAAANQGLRDNVFLLTSLILMQNAFNDNQEIVSEIFKLWHEKGFTDFREKIIACMVYITEIRNISLDHLKKKLDENKINGGEIMQTLAQVLRNEGKEIGFIEGQNKGKEIGFIEGQNKGLQEGLKEGINRGEKERAKKVALTMLLDKCPIETIKKYSGLTEKEIRALMR